MSLSELPGGCPQAWLGLDVPKPVRYPQLAREACGHRPEPGSESGVAPPPDRVADRLIETVSRVCTTGDERRGHVVTGMTRYIQDDRRSVKLWGLDSPPRGDPDHPLE